MSRIIEGRLSQLFLSQAGLTGVIESEFQSAVNIRFGEAGLTRSLLTITPPESEGLPDSVIVNERIFQQIRLLPVGTHVEKHGDEIRFERLIDPLTDLSGRNRSCRMDALIDPSAGFQQVRSNICSLNRIFIRDGLLERSGFSSLPGKGREGILETLRLICSGWLKGDSKTLTALILKCIGTGPGLTPSADDALLGIMAFMSAFNVWRDKRIAAGMKPELPHINAARAADLPDLGSIFKDLTTSVSLKYICCAQEGRFAESINVFLSRIFGRLPAGFEDMVFKIAMFGGFSGKDLLVGITLAGAALNELGLAEKGGSFI